MKSIGPIELPIKGVEVVNRYEDIMDVLMDVHIKDMPKVLEDMFNRNMPQILVINKDDISIVGVIAYQPLEKWKSYDDQNLMMFLGPNISKMTEYFTNWHNSCHDPFEQKAIRTIILYIDNLRKQIEYRQNQQADYSPGSTSST
jgi:hypothetical protein